MSDAAERPDRTPTAGAHRIAMRGLPPGHYDHDARRINCGMRGGTGGERPGRGTGMCRPAGPGPAAT
jgi:hypothetical protein